MLRNSTKLAALLALGVLFTVNPVLADDPPPTDGGQDPPEHPAIVQPPVSGLDVLVDAWTLLLRMTTL